MSFPGRGRHRGPRVVGTWAAFLVPVCLLGCASTPPAAAPRAPSTPPAPSEYRLERDDQVEVRLRLNPELNVIQPVRPDGRIALELVGEVEAAGLTPEELRRALVARYGSVLREPEVAVIVKKFAGQRIYVGGEVGAPGVLSLEGGTTALRAIFQAGGFKDTGAVGQVVVLRDRKTAEPLFLSLDLGASLSGKAPANDLVLQPNDIVFVPKTRIAKIDQFVHQYIRELIPATLTLGLTYYLGAPFN